MTDRIYMDYNATAPPRDEVRTAVTELMSSPHNASSVHGFGQDARKAVEEAREKIAALVGAPATQVIFNSGATEANNTVLKHFAGERILVSTIEHPSVLMSASEAEHIPVTKDGVVDLEALETLLKKEQAALVSVMLVNNETGVIQPIEKIAELAKTHGALVHCDAVQAASKIPIDINTMRVDFLTLSAHKIGGLQGCGALILGLCGITPTLLHGGSQEKQTRAGTENVPGIISFGIAAELAAKELETTPKKLQSYREKLEAKLREIDPNTIIHGEGAPRVCNTTNFALPGMRADSLLMAFDLENIALSNGSACTSGTVKASHVLMAMGASEEEATSALRISLGWDTKDSDIEQFIEAWSKIHERVTSDKEPHA